MSKQKQKGTNYENKIRDAFRKHDIEAHRGAQLTHAITNPELDADVILGSMSDPKFKVECKFRSSVPKSIYNWLDGNDFLVVKKIGREYQDIVCLNLDKFLDLFTQCHPELKTDNEQE